VFDQADKPGISNLLTIYATLTGRPVAEIEQEYAGRGYGDFKKALGEVVVEFVTPFRNQTLELLDDPAELDRVLADGAARAREVASQTLRAVYDRVGFVPAPR
jgi:tryptophanyl-tRNA synthetase